mgnify:CR=1 FL=1
MLTKKEIITKISELTDNTPNEVNTVVNALIDVISDEIAARNDCRIHGLGTFRATRSKKRIGRNPYSGDAMRIPEKVRVRFRPGFKLKNGADRASEILKLYEIAKLMVSELLLYNSKEIDQGILADDLEKRLESKLKDARQNFLNRIPKGVEADISIFENAWIKFIIKRKKALATMN